MRSWFVNRLDTGLLDAGLLDIGRLDSGWSRWYRYERMTLALLYVAPLGILVAATHGTPPALTVLAVVVVVGRAYGERAS